MDSPAASSAALLILRPEDSFSIAFEPDVVLIPSWRWVFIAIKLWLILMILPP
jgi:hypothetical protein